MASTDPSPSPAPAALAAFLRGVERRGAVFAELQCGEAERGDVALAAALRAFRAKATALPMADWPQRFWTLLAATPQLRGAAPDARWPGALADLGRSAPIDRAALLLRLAGGLQEAEAAEALGVDSRAYRDALARACPRDADGQPDAAAWRALAEAIQHHARELSPDRLARLARLRDEALAGTRMPPAASKAGTPAPAPAAEVPRRRRWPWLVLAVALVAVAAAAVLGWRQWRGVDAASPAPSAASAGAGTALIEDPVITVAELPPVEPPAARFDEAATIATHPDFALLADDESDTFAREADFLAWYVAGGSAAEAPATEVADAGR